MPGAADDLVGLIADLKALHFKGLDREPSKNEPRTVQLLTQLTDRIYVLEDLVVMNGVMKEIVPVLKSLIGLIEGSGGGNGGGGGGGSGSGSGSDPSPLTFRRTTFASRMRMKNTVVISDSSSSGGFDERSGTTQSNSGERQNRLGSSRPATAPVGSGRPAAPRKNKGHGMTMREVDNLFKKE